MSLQPTVSNSDQNDEINSDWQNQPIITEKQKTLNNATNSVANDSLVQFDKHSPE